MKRNRIIPIFLILLLMLCLSACSQYRRSDFLGKTSAQIESQYGKFDVIGSFVSTDSKYRDFGYGYRIKESRVGFLGTSPAEYFVIIFDQNGFAVDCYEAYYCDGG